MAFLLVGVSLSLVSTSALDLTSTVVQNFDAVQLQGLTLVGNFLHQQALPVPWMQQSQSHDRRLQTPAALPEACKAACPGAEAVMNGLQQKMMTAMEPYAADMAGMMTSQGSGSTDLKAMMEKMEPMMKAMIEVTFEDMCQNAASYECIMSNPSACSDDSSSSMSSMMNPMANDPRSMANQYGPVLECICNVCPGSKKAYIEFSSMIVSIVVQGFSSIGSTPSQTQADAMKNDVMKAMCPFVGVARCFDTNPTKCKAMTQGSTQQGLSMAMSGNASLADLKGECDKAGISTAAAKLQAVTTEITIAGLDFTKVNSNTQFKNDLVSNIKTNLLTKMPGYVPDDISISLSAGSVKASVMIDPVPGSNPTQVQSTLNSAKTNVQSEVLTKVKSMSALSSVLKDGTTSDQLTVSMTEAAAASSSAVDGGVALHKVAVPGMVGLVLSQFAI